MSGFVIVVDFHLKPGSKTAFRRLIDENARTSCRDEPGCRRFDVLEPAGPHHLFVRRLEANGGPAGP